MSVEEVVSRLKAYEKRIRGYNEKDKEKHYLFIHKWLGPMKKKNVNGSFSRQPQHGK